MSPRQLGTGLGLTGHRLQLGEDVGGLIGAEHDEIAGGSRSHGPTHCSELLQLDRHGAAAAALGHPAAHPFGHHRGRRAGGPTAQVAILPHDDDVEMLCGDAAQLPQILIPAGSRLFGDYSSDVAIGQGRILVAWTRLVTPDGQSVQMEAFGGDAQGRSGITGKVNTRFGARFGSAALISLLGAAPAVAAAKYTDEISSDTAESMGEDLGTAMGSAVEAYTSLPPIITVAPGAAITVMVDRDLEIW